MKIFIVTQTYGSGLREVLYFAHRSVLKALAQVDNRTGQKNDWTEHNSHGRCWVTSDQRFTVEELEVIE